MRKRIDERLNGAKEEVVSMLELLKTHGGGITMDIATKGVDYIAMTSIEAGANRSPCSNIYTGASPFSEQEMVGIRDYIATQISDLKVYISLHSYGQLFLSPWGYTEEKPHNYEDQRMAAKLAVEAIKNSTGANYYYGTIAELMYPASGTSIDYWQAKGVPYIYGIELRPEDLDDNYGFTIPAEWIAPTGQEMLVALKKIGEYLAVHKRI